MARYGARTCVPPKTVLRLLNRDQRARLLFLIARVLAKGGLPLAGDRHFMQTLLDLQGNPHRCKSYGEKDRSICDS